MLHSLSWHPVVCTSYSWVLHKLLALLTLCLMNLWDPMSPHLMSDVRRVSIWRHREGPHLTSSAPSTPSTSTSSDKRLQGWLTQRSATDSEVTQVSRTRKTVGLGPTALMFAIWQVILDLLSLSIFICAVKLITPTLNSCYIFDKFHLSGGSRDDVRAWGTAATMLSIDCLCNTLLHTAAGNSWCFGKWPVTDGIIWYREKQRPNK